MYFGIHDDVFANEGNLFAIGFQEFLQDRGSTRRTTELDTLCRIHQLDRQDMIQIVHNLKELRRRIGSHTHMVFLPVTGHDRVAAGGITVHLVLAHHAGCRILRDHKAGIQSGIGNQKFRQAPKAHDQLRDTAFGNISQLSQRNCKEIVGDRQRLAVEITSGDDLVLVGKDRRERSSGCPSRN